MSKMNLLVVDIDGTLVPESAVPHEPDASLPPNRAMCELLRSIAANKDWRVEILTSRLVRWQKRTLDFLGAHCPIDAEVDMRSEKDWSLAPEYKLTKVGQLVIEHKPVQLVCIDSRIDVCAAYRDKGYFTMEPML